MLGKSKGKSKKKKGKKGDGSTLSSALTQPAMLAAVPTTPTPHLPKKKFSGISSTLLSSSLLSRLFNKSEPVDKKKEETENTQPQQNTVGIESDLNDYSGDYEEEPGYSTVGSVQFRAMVSPPSGFSDSDYELEAPRRSDPGLRGSRDSQTTTEVVIEPMYATPYKSRPSSGRRKSGSPSPRDRSYGTESDKSFRDSQTYSGYQRDESPEATLRSSGGRSRSAASNGRRAPIDIEERPPYPLPSSQVSSVSSDTFEPGLEPPPPGVKRRAPLPPSQPHLHHEPLYISASRASSGSEPALTSPQAPQHRSQTSLAQSRASSEPMINQSKSKSSSLKNSAKALFSKVRSSLKIGKSSKRSSTASLDGLDQSVTPDRKAATLPRNFQQSTKEAPTSSVHPPQPAAPPPPAAAAAAGDVNDDGGVIVHAMGDVISPPVAATSGHVNQAGQSVNFTLPQKRKSPTKAGKSGRKRTGQQPPSGEQSQSKDCVLDTSQIEQDRVHSTASVTDFRSVTDLSHTASLRLRTLQDQNVHLLEKQRHLEDQLANQLQAQRSLMEKLERHGLLTTQNPDETTASIHDMASLMQETQSITELTLNKHEKLHTSHKERIFVLEKEKNELTELNEQLQAEIISMRRMSSFRDQDEEGGTQAGLLKKQLQDYKDECDTLKSATQRLSSELSRYQAQFRTLPPNELDELPGLPSRGPKPAWLVNTKYLAPLFLAYDDHLREKEGLLQQCQKDIEHFLQEIEKVVKENQRLHIRLEQTDVTGPLGMTEWRSLQEQCKLVLEENQLLMEQLDVQQNKGRDMHKAHVQEVSILSKRLVATEAESSELQQEVAEIKQKYSSMKKQHDEAVIDSRAKPGLDDHLKAVSDLRRLLDDEQGKHGMEIDNIQAQLQTISAEKKGMAAQVTDLQQENQHLETQIRNLLKKHRKSEKKMAILRQALEAAESKEFTAERYLTSVVRMAEKTVHERDSLSQTLTDHERQHKATINKALHGKVAVGRMEEKLKSYKVKATEKLELAASRLKEQDNDFNKQRQEYERELKHMRLMLKERQEMFEGVSTEKRLVEEDLETMWQVASHDNQKMKETVRKTINKLKDHDGLLTRMPTDEFQKEILHSCFSDED